ncbi:MAG: hypothetical protein ACLF0G_06850, partial [Candidatus Brocadiia bacterium]
FKKGFLPHILTPLKGYKGTTAKTAFSIAYTVVALWDAFPRRALANVRIRSHECNNVETAPAGDLS